MFALTHLLLQTYRLLSNFLTCFLVISVDKALDRNVSIVALVAFGPDNSLF